MADEPVCRKDMQHLVEKIDLLLENHEERHAIVISNVEIFKQDLDALKADFIDFKRFYERLSMVLSSILLAVFIATGSQMINIPFGI